METLIIEIPEDKRALIKNLLKELGVVMYKNTPKKAKVPNALTRKTIEDARKGIGVGEPITDINAFLNSL